jgi:predicted alpha/beta superfamily hydrolase
MKKLVVLIVMVFVLTGCGGINVSKNSEGYKKKSDISKKEEYQLVEGSKLLATNEKALTGNIKVIPDFNIKSLNRKRNIWVYLPPSYDKSNDKYPVLYMQDGQSIFKSKDTEWHVDETLESIFKNNKEKETIVVGIESDPKTRFNEYAPWKNPAGDGGEGDLYVDFIVKELKPYIDKKFRTLKDRENTSIAGASMGGYISLYAAMKYQGVFGKAAAFSPIFGFYKEPYVNFIKKEKMKKDVKIYLDAGQNEEDFPTAADDVTEMGKLLLNVGFKKEHLKVVIDPNGQHKIDSWSKRFPGAFIWLMNN